MASSSSSSPPQNNAAEPQPEVQLNGFGRPIDYDDLDLGSDMDTDSEDDGMPPYVVPERDQLFEYVHEIITGIRRLTPVMRELAKSQIRLILQRYLRPDLADEPQRAPPSAPRVSHHG